MGNMLTQYPELFGAIVCQVPLLDMKRYTSCSAGASWMAEYGDPDKPEEWAFIQTFSPYQNVEEGKRLPADALHTSTRDDRVGPGHARKMVARMHEMGTRRAATTRTSKAATAARPTTSRRRTCTRWHTRSSGII